MLQPELANAFRDRKLANLEPLQAEVIVSANIGCIQHLQSGTADAGAPLGRGARRGAGAGAGLSVRAPLSGQPLTPSSLQA